MTELVTTLTLQMGLPIEYVMDRMKMFEATAFMKHAHAAHRDEWEQARLIAYIVAQVNSTKKLAPSDIIAFPWEKNDAEPDIAAIEELKEKAKEYEKYLRQKNNNVETR